jgi:hypothetical protein
MNHVSFIIGPELYVVQETLVFGIMFREVRNGFPC